MLSRSLDRATQFTRRDALRLGVAAVLLVAGLTAILVADDLPRGVDLTVGDIAAAEVRAPRKMEFSSEVETEAARVAAAAAVPPQYSFAADTTAAIALRQLDALAGAIGPLDAVFALELSPASRQVALAGQLPWLSRDARRTLESLGREEWSALAAEATRVLGLVQRTEIRDADLETVRAALGDRVAQSFDASERALVAEIVSPFLAPNSSYSQALTDVRIDRMLSIIRTKTSAVISLAISLSATRNATCRKIRG